LTDRFFLTEPPREGRAVLRGEEAHHLSRVKRVAVGQEVELFDGAGGGFRAVVRSLGKSSVELDLIEPLADRRPPLELTLATAVPKGDRFDWLVEKATELGVARLVPLRTARSSVDPRSSKLDRLRRVVVEACKQCGRSQLMDLADPVDWAVHADRETAAVRLLADPAGAGISSPGPVPQVAVAIGPEGGFTAEEVAVGVEAGWSCVRLGPTILRIETAALAACAVVLVGSFGGATA
jgi:16S rRNA (uracil1498-N3)-methyltransferase